MHKHFVDWYRLADPEPKGETLDLRWRGVENFARKKKRETWLDCVRLFLGFPPSKIDVTDELIGAFKDADAAFTSKDNELLLQVLAGAALMKVLDGESTRADLVALALLCAHCRGAGPTGPFAAPVETARGYINKRARAVRSLTTPGAKLPQLKRSENPVTDIGEIDLNATNGWGPVQNNFNSVKSAFTELRDAIEDVHKQLNSTRGEVNEVARLAVAKRSDRQFEALREETNVLWWLFGEYSRDLDRPLGDIGLPGSAVIAGKELSDLTRIIPGPVGAQAFLDKAIRLADASPPDMLRLVDAVNATPRNWRDSWASGLKLKVLSGISPGLTATIKSLETERENDWIPAFEKASNFDGDCELSPLDLSEQIYEECLLVRLSESAE